MTKLKFSILLILMAGIAAIPACKKKAAGAREAQQASSANEPLSTAFVVKTPIAIQASPEARAKAVVALPVGAAVDIFGTRVADLKTPDTAFWYKVRFTAPGAAAPVEGFVSEREEVLRENFLVFNKKTEERTTVEDAQGNSVDKVGVPGVMATTSVNLRKSPAMNGAVIRQLKNGEVLKVLAISASTVEIDKKRAEWYFVSDAQGQTGYCFGGYMLAGLYDELAQLQDVGFRFIHGWATVTAKYAKALRAPVGADTFNLNSLPMADSDKPKSEILKGAILEIDGETTKSTDRYRVLARFEAEPEYFIQKYYYIAKSDVKFTGDYFTISGKQPHKIEKTLAKDLNTYLRGDVNLQCTRVLPFEGGSDSEKRSFLAIQTALGHAYSVSEDNGKISCLGVNERISLLVETKEGKNIFLGKLGRGEVSFVDLDNNGAPEVVSETYQMRAGSFLQVYAIAEGRLSPIFSYSNEPDTCLSARLEGRYLIVEGGAAEDSDEQLTERCGKNLAEMLKENKAVALNTKHRSFPAYLRYDGAKFQPIEKPDDLPGNPG
ncbi:SH3 domain-containing protein [Turneriella parva]|uniref:SH3 type 3 domain protein n=1 Tax=Turneriella parva (strain ATCC BAA-1111 / DSM 21527 / NCTC 11395 / H) TaxID=869212 RepID=I4B7B3_TURPD|nr:SH3 domain-containing protein [Turneriella parva]AFM13170.1 SH3 type 3 domain protein [Turneriella parva DSM 21527]